MFYATPPRLPARRCFRCRYFLCHFFDAIFRACYYAIYAAITCYAADDTFDAAASPADSYG